MNTRQAKHLARNWVETNRGSWPGLRAAHFVGSITTLPDEAHFPDYKDVDLHLIFDESSPMLESHGPFPPLLEVPYHGVIIEAGLKPISDYRTSEIVLANPELAHHLTVDSTIYDPEGMLTSLCEAVTRDYARRRWVLARVEHERRSLNGKLSMLPMVRQAFGAAGEASILGYSMASISALFSDVTLRSPTTGSRMLLRMRDIMAEYGRGELYEEALFILGLENVELAYLRRCLDEGLQAFDVAVQVKRSFHPFGHKLNPHQRGYFADACRSLAEEGHVREAMSWVCPFYMSSIGVILADGSDNEKPYWTHKLDALLDDLGMTSEAQRDEKIARLRRWHEVCFALADEIMAQNPAIID